MTIIKTITFTDEEYKILKEKAGKECLKVNTFIKRYLALGFKNEVANIKVANSKEDYLKGYEGHVLYEDPRE